MSDRLLRLVRLMHPPAPKKEEGGGGEMIEVSVPASTAAVIYERVRNTLEYQEDHLLRRNAILRILTRYVGASDKLSQMAGNLLQELVWAKYLPNKTVPVSLAQGLAETITRYEPLLEAAERLEGRKTEGVRFVLELLATEIERILAPNDADEALAAFMYDELSRRIDWDPALQVSEEDRDVRLFVAVYRALFKVDPATLRYRIFILYYPTWTSLAATDPLVADVARQFDRVMSAVDQQMSDRLTDRLYRLIRRKGGVFRALGDIIKVATPEQVADLDWIEKAVSETLKTRTTEFRTRLSRGVMRSILFLLITKTLLALVLEVPYNLLAIGYLPVFPLTINILFHPFFLACIALTIRVPETQNEADYKAAILALAKGENHPVLHVRVKREVRGRWSLFFNFLYAVLFAAVYVGIGYLLHSIHFHAPSIGLFLFFFSLMTFFGVRLRSSIKDIVASDSRSGFLGTAFDVLLLPIVRAGSWLSAKVAKINIFIYFFDFIVEAPLKVAIEFVEGWLRFVREKKEEI